MSATAPRIGLDCEDRRYGMTLDELTTFVSQAHSASVPPDTPLGATLGWRQQIQKIETHPERLTRARARAARTEQDATS